MEFEKLASASESGRIRSELSSDFVVQPAMMIANAAKDFMAWDSSNVGPRLDVSRPRDLLSPD